MEDDMRDGRRAIRMTWTTMAVLTLAVSNLATSAARADEPKGCDAFKWPLKPEAVQLQAPTKAVAPTDGTAKANGTAYDLTLVPLAQAGLPQPPEHKPKMGGSTAGYVRFAAPATAGPYQVAVSQAAWIDIVQDGRYVKPSAFSGATDCPGVRKSIRFDLAPGPFLIQISGTTAPSLAMLVEPVHP